MPKLFVSSIEGTFTPEARSRIAADLTDLGMRCEKLADTDAVRGGVWVMFSEWSPDAVFSGGKAAATPRVVLTVNALQGGLDASARTEMIAGATAILNAAAGESDPPAVYVVIHEVAEADWGMNGKQVSIAALRQPAPN